jgi:hypothetical protein
VLGRFGWWGKKQKPPLQEGIEFKNSLVTYLLVETITPFHDQDVAHIRSQLADVMLLTESRILQAWVF